MPSLEILLGIVAAVVLVGVLAVRVSVRLGLPSLLLYLGIGIVLGESVLGIQFSDAALTESSKTARPPGDAFSAAVDTQSTLLYGGFSPTTTLDETARLAVTNPRFGGARVVLRSRTAAAGFAFVLGAGSAARARRFELELCPLHCVVHRDARLVCSLLHLLTTALDVLAGTFHRVATG